MGAHKGLGVGTYRTEIGKATFHPLDLTGILNTMCHQIQGKHILGQIELLSITILGMPTIHGIITGAMGHRLLRLFKPDGKSIIYQCAKDLNSSRYLYIRSQSERQISEHMPPWYNLFINTVVDFS